MRGRKNNSYLTHSPLTIGERALTGDRSDFDKIHNYSKIFINKRLKHGMFITNSEKYSSQQAVGHSIRNK